MIPPSERARSLFSPSSTGTRRRRARSRRGPGGRPPAWPAGATGRSGRARPPRRRPAPRPRGGRPPNRKTHRLQRMESQVDLFFCGEGFWTVFSPTFSQVLTQNVFKYIFSSHNSLRGVVVILTAFYLNSLEFRRSPRKSASFFRGAFASLLLVVKCQQIII